uniref:Uncharacterized protein n=1 Tax=Anguilla anguilla TaxID=7936 RepID=A0A0E9V7K7_ANGAN
MCKESRDNLSTEVFPPHTKQ